jgi:predicted alpha/beta-hydrolase family hydrolase
MNADPAHRFAMPAEWRVSVGGDTTTAVYEPADAQSAVFVCAHGAGGHMADRGLVKVAETMRSVGLGVVRFNFLYREQRSSRPDPMPRLMECISAVVARVRDEVAPRAIVIGGRSMGGRAASMLAADGFPSDGLLLLAYPLHPAGQPEKLRDAHLPAITMPVLCVSGTRDPLCRRDLMERAVRTVTTHWTMHWLEGADHSFHVLKSSGRTDSEVLQEVAEATRSWLTASIA